MTKRQMLAAPRASGVSRSALNIAPNAAARTNDEVTKNPEAKWAKGLISTICVTYDERGDCDVIGVTHCHRARSVCKVYVQCG